MAYGKMTVTEKRRALMGRDIGDYVSVKNHHDQVIARGKIVDVDVKDQVLSIECYSRYTLTTQGYINQPETFIETINIGDIAVYSDSSESEVKGSSGISPYVENLGKNVILSVKGRDYIGRLSQIFQNTFILRPYVSSWNSLQGEYELINDELFVPFEENVLRPLKKPLEVLVQEFNEHSEQEKNKKTAS